MGPEGKAGELVPRNRGPRAGWEQWVRASIGDACGEDSVGGDVTGPRTERLGVLREMRLNLLSIDARCEVTAF